jgi:D-glycero-alpha-D-manno-heptose 1-phosphate guanylyltransferase
MLADCIVLAGGLGTRLQTVVADRPKCLAEVCGKPFLYYLLRYLNQYPPNQLILSVGYKKEMIHEFVESIRSAVTYPIVFVEESNPLGTGGAILKSTEAVQTEDFFVLNGDTFFEVNLDRMLAFQKQKMADCTLALKFMQQADRYGLVGLDEQDAIVSFQEKTPGGSGLINAGVYCLFKNSFLRHPFPEVFSFEKDFLEARLNELNIFGFEQPNYFIDIGVPEDYQQAQLDFIHR